jgi:hypothetical protein
MTSCEKSHNSPDSDHDFGIDRYVGPIDTSWRFWPTQRVLALSLRAATGTQMSERESFSDLVYEQQTQLAERELYSFIAAVTELYGPEQAKVSAEDWLDEADVMDSPPRSEARDWRSVTIAASARLASRVNERGVSAMERSA